VWYGGNIFEQDYLLKVFVEQKQISRILYLEDDGHVQSIIGHQVETDAQMCVYVVNRTFQFSSIIKICNETLSKLGKGSWLYLSINKFLAIPEPQLEIPEQYDDAIYSYITSGVKYKLQDYITGKNDYGNRFNWVHPLTRFYFYNDNSD